MANEDQGYRLRKQRTTNNIKLLMLVMWSKLHYYYHYYYWATIFNIVSSIPETINRSSLLLSKSTVDMKTKTAMQRRDARCNTGSMPNSSTFLPEETEGAKHGRRHHRTRGDITPPLSDAGGQGGHNLGIILISNIQQHTYVSRPT